jgi:hypothetical protein
LSQFGGLKVDVSESLGTRSFAVGDDAGRDYATDGGEDVGEPVLVDVPREVTNEDGG